MENNFSLIRFEDGGLTLDVRLDSIHETVWLDVNEIAALFEVQRPAVVKHINTILGCGELDSSTCSVLEQVRKEGTREVVRKINLYNLEMVISVGYRVNSKRGIAFRRWANAILKQYLLEGYAINQKRLARLNRTVEVQRALIANYAEGSGADADEVLSVLDRFTDALNLLDDYDHQCLSKPKKSDLEVKYLTERECFDLIKRTSFTQRGDLFGREKQKGCLKGILDQIAQYVFGKELYPSIPEKAANLLYFLVKDHIFADGNKRIAALLYLAFLHKNGLLVKPNGGFSIANDGLAALTILIAESKPSEKEIMVAVTMNMTGK